MSDNNKSMACPSDDVTSKLNDVERAALARAVKQALYQALHVRNMMETDPNYAGFFYDGFDSTGPKLLATDRIKIEDIVRELDMMDRYLSSTVGLDVLGRIVTFLYEWFGPSMIDKLFKDKGFDPEDNPSGVGFGKLGAISNQGIKQVKIERTETEVTCDGNTGCDYTVNGKTFEPR